MRLRSITGAVLLMLSGAVAPAGATAISVESRVVQPDEIFSINIGILDVVNLGAFAFDVTYDPTLISLVGVSEGEFLARGGVTGPCTVGAANELATCYNEPGLVSIGNFLLASDGVSDDGLGGVLATLQFLALMPGSSEVVLSLVSLSTPLFEETVEDIPVETTGSGRIEVAGATPVPEPSTLVLLGIGLAGLTRNRMRRRPRPA